MTDLEDAIAALRNDGAVCIRGAVGRDDLDLATDAVEANLANLSSLAQRASGEDDGDFIEDFCSWQRLPALERFVRTSDVSSIAGTLMGASMVRFYHDHLLVKRAGTRQRTPWHQDQPYYNVDGVMNVSVWLPIDPVARSSTLEFIAGSHHGPWYLPRTFLDGHAAWFPPGELEEPPDFSADPDRYRVLGWELEPGDAVFFNMATVHGSAGVPDGGDRRVLSLRFLGDDMVFAPRPWVTSPPFDGLHLEAGAPMDDDRFPVVWTRAGGLTAPD